ncbi:TlpA family protein disulfide reductase [Maribacter polysiphoniae]|uniref:Peroxiredoxin n=1 Tax=Maribacter polysiphoniae TaxID=429344 RepID=A0A316DNX8_9FLAO|nr:TlpA disulfide reductase family protein [Maribacter polysiphoniae]MBD1263172.1 TlpA family protein disulfide reductase [Maribacter polysiphoniae]PWK18463.1 peroxiredoxin [Maribacter polysiphoniae]
MKFSVVLLFCIYLLLTQGCSNEKIFKLPITFQEGYGPFDSAMVGISPYSDNENDPWKKTHLKTSGIPKNWTDVKIGDVDTDIYQSVYQNYYLGNITKERYEELQKTWGWEPDSINLSKKPIKSKIAFVFGKDSVGELQMIVDANNNHDFSDDDIFKPTEVNPKRNINNDSLVKSSAIKVSFEQFSNDKIIQVSAPLLIVHMKQYNIFLSNFAQYATARFQGEEIAISSNNFTNLSYDKVGIIKVGDLSEKGDKADFQSLIAKNEFLEIENGIYKNLGVKKNENVLVLEKMDLPKSKLPSTQIGFKAYDFSGDDFKTKTPITLDSLKGKYVFLDFWATWCGPCIQEMPNLTDLYENIDKSKFEIIGIVGDSPVEDLEKMIIKHSISWPQIISNDSNKIKETYGIGGYPTTFLLNPNGIIVAKNLRGKELEKKVTDLMNE